MDMLFQVFYLDGHHHGRPDHDLSVSIKKLKIMDRVKDKMSMFHSLNDT